MTLVVPSNHPIGVVVHFTGTFGSSLNTNYLFASQTQADEAFDKITTAMNAYKSRTNDRDDVVTFDHLTGRATIDVGNVTALSVDDVFGENGAMIDQWQRRSGEMFRLARGEVAPD